MASELKKGKGYWDGVSLFTEVEEDQNVRISIEGYSLFQEKQLLSSREDMDEKAFIRAYLEGKVTFWNTRRFPDVLFAPLIGAEYLFKSIGALFVMAYTYTRDKREKYESMASTIGWGALSVVTGILNALIAQPLFFVANTILHARAFCDGALRVVSAGFAKIGAAFLSCFKSTQATATSLSNWGTQKGISGLKTLAKSGLFLLADAFVGALAYGLSALCSVIPGAQLAVPFLTGGATAVQAAVGGSILGAAQTAIVVSSVVATAAVSKLAQSAAQGRSAQIFTGLGVTASAIDPAVAAQEDEIMSSGMRDDEADSPAPASAADRDISVIVSSLGAAGNATPPSRSRASSQPQKQGDDTPGPTPAPMTVSPVVALPSAAVGEPERVPTPVEAYDVASAQIRTLSF